MRQLQNLISDSQLYDHAELQPLIDRIFSLGSGVVLVLGATSYRGTSYPPVVDMLIEMLYSYIRECIQKHISGIAPYVTGLNLNPRTI